MDKEIKRLLKLKKIPAFQLSAEEELKLKEWEKAQKPVKAKAPRKKTTRKKKVTNDVKIEEKEASIFEIEGATPIEPIIHEEKVEIEES